MIVAALLAFALIAGVIVWMVSTGGGPNGTNAAPTTTTSTVTSTTPTSRTTSRPPTTTTSSAPGVAERCAAAFVRDEVDDDATVRECDSRFLLIDVKGGDLELYTWRDDKWSFLAEPSSDVCREQLQQIGVPNSFRRVFQPCAAATSTTSKQSSTTSKQSSTTSKQSSTTQSTKTSTTQQTTTKRTTSSTPTSTVSPTSASENRSAEETPTSAEENSANSTEDPN